MINKFFRLIHNKYPTFLNFIFFLRYLFLIFFIALAFFLIIPKFFNYDNKIQTFKTYLSNNYGLKIDDYEKIKFHFFPLPQIEIKNVKTNIEQISSNLFIDKIILYPELLSIYNYENFKTKKIILKKSKIQIEILEFNSFVKYILNKKKSFSIKNLDLIILNKDERLMNLKNLNFSNYGNNKNIFFGKIFDKKFTIKFDKNFKNMIMKIPEIGFETDIEFKNIKNNLIDGKSRIKIMRTNLKFDFLYKDKKFEIFNSYFRNKDLVFTNQSSIVLYPYFNSNSSFLIEEINTKLFEKFNYKKFINYKTIIKKINSKNEIIFIAKKFNRQLIDELYLITDLAYGRLNFEKRLLISDSTFECKGSINMFEDLPILDFNCLIFAKDRKNFLKIFSIKYKNKDEELKLNIQGQLSLMNNKVNFFSIKSNDYIASKEDLQYFKNQFENILLDKDFLEIFNLKNIKKFILEIS